MQDDSPAHTGESAERYLPRQREMDAFAERLPLRGVEARHKRVFNLWGERGVGKSSFLSEFRESELMAKAKVVWLQPTRNGKVDTISEFIRACAQSVRYPNQPEEEKQLSERLERVQRGKVNPIVSDDSILITRSSIANNKKPYVNKAAAASVGRTEKVQEELQVNVGLGESKATNHAEGFLDALPLQSLGTDLTIIHIDRLSQLSVSIVDWLRDYVFPAATRGPYRRSVILLLEELDPLRLAHPNETWGEWASLVDEFRLYPLSEDDTYELGLRSGLPPEAARFLYAKTLGYPGGLRESVAALRQAAAEADSWQPRLDSLNEDQQLAAAAFSLPDRIHPDELDALFGHGQGEPALQTLRSLPEAPLRPAEQGKSLSLPLGFRLAAFRAAAENDAFSPARSRWTRLGRLLHNAPQRSERSRLLLLASLLWIDRSLCEQLFGDQAAKVFAFITEHPQFFNRAQDRFRLSPRLQPELRQVAQTLRHIGAGAVHRKALALWRKRSEELERRSEELEQEIAALQQETNSLSRRRKEAMALSRIQERATEEGAAAHSGGLRSWLPKWLRPRRDDRENPSPRKQSQELGHTLQERESRLEQLQAERDQTRRERAFAYVRAEEDAPSAP